MPESLKVLRRRVKSIKSTKQITRAMEMVSAAKLRRAQEALLAARPYANKLQELLASLAGSASVESHPLFQEREAGPQIMVVFTSDRGLCGSFNSNIIRLAERRLKDSPGVNWQLFCIGKNGYEYFKSRPWPIIDYKLDLGGRPDNDMARSISEDLRSRFESGAASAIWLAYPKFITLAINRPAIVKFLHLDADELAGAAPAETQGDDHAQETEYILEPSPERVFDALLPRYLTSKIYITLAEVFTSEHSARMLAMNNATKACDDLSESLTLQMNKARQAQITRELIEIISGAQAV
jgi:F-type H+-transporting ATPase subunit gamma